MGNGEKHRVLRTVARASFLVLIFSLGFMQPDVKISGLAVNCTELIFVATAAIWLVATAFGAVQLRLHRSYYLFAFYLLTLCLSAGMSENPKFSGIKLLGEIYLVGLAVMTLNIANDARFVKKIVFAWLAAASIVSVVGTVTVVCFYIGVSNVITDFALHHYGSLPAGPYPRIQSTFLYPSMLCNYLTVALMMLFAARHLRWIPAYVFLTLVTLFSITAAFTVTPGLGGLLFAVGVWFWWVFKGRERTYLSWASLASGVIAGFLFQLVSTFSVITTPTSPYHFTVGEMRIDPAPRLLTWQGAVQTFLEHPVFGKGLGLAVASVYFQTPSGEMLLVTDAHNFILNIAAQAGLPGALALIAICVAVIRSARLFKADENGPAVLRLCLGIAFVSAFILQGLVGSFEDARHLWVLIGLVFAVDRISQTDPDLG